MTRAIFTTRISPEYDDQPEFYYHFPKQYLGRVERTIGDWIIYYEPSRTGGRSSRREGRKAYFAMARVVRVREDTRQPNHFYADVADYQGFDRAVPFREGDHFYESALRNELGETATGVFQNAVRTIAEEECDLIVRAGFAAVLGEGHTKAERASWPGLGEDQAEFERPIIEQVSRRPFRDATFMHNIRNAYDSTCSMTGLRLINGGGRPEIEAAHIRPVGEGHNGPDSVRNGLALSRTTHWMFDRGLLSLTDDYEILVAENYVPSRVQKFLNPDRRLVLPSEEAAWPHGSFVKYHRDTIFRG